MVRRFSRADRLDANKLARLGRVDPQSLFPIEDRSPEVRQDLVVLRARDALVQVRTQLGAGGFPPRRWHAVRQQKALAHIDAAAPPARGVSKRSAETPLAHPPDGYHRGRVPRRHGREKKFKDGRHVDLDFYDLLIEATKFNQQPPWVGPSPTGDLRR